MDEDLQKALDRIGLLRKLRTTAPGDATPGLSERELSRQIVLDTLQIMVRLEVALKIACDVIETHTEATRDAATVDRQQAEATSAALAVQARQIGTLAKLGTAALESKPLLMIASSISTLVFSALAHWGWIVVGM